MLNTRQCQDAYDTFQWPLTQKLRGRTTARDKRRGRTLSSRARGDTTDSHGPFQRLLEDGSKKEPPLLEPPG